MYDVERIVKIVSDIEKHFRDLEELKIEEIADIEVKRNFYALFRDAPKSINGKPVLVWCGGNV